MTSNTLAALGCLVILLLCITTPRQHRSTTTFDFNLSIHIEIEAEPSIIDEMPKYNGGIK